MLVETSERQAAVIAEAMAGVGMRPRVARDEELNATVVIGAA